MCFSNVGHGKMSLTKNLNGFLRRIRGQLPLLEGSLAGQTMIEKMRHGMIAGFRPDRRGSFVSAKEPKTISPNQTESVKRRSSFASREKRSCSSRNTRYASRRTISENPASGLFNTPLKDKHYAKHNKIFTQPHGFRLTGERIPLDQTFPATLQDVGIVLKPRQGK